ncbi:MAG: response regulator of RpoS [Syntrophus sp. PtaU1.Bin208]|nr:MAG: response regulator of RpoS [Syntrophus sp. PtaU1.Bin208]
MSSIRVSLFVKRSVFMGKSILVVDDDSLIRSFISKILKADGDYVEESDSGRKGLEKPRAADFEMVFPDLRKPGFPVLDLICEGRKLRPESDWIIITMNGAVGDFYFKATGEKNVYDKILGGV